MAQKDGKKELNIIGIIPARMGSSRFPGKPLAKILGMPMIGHVYKNSKSSLLKKLYIATCDKEIADYAASIGAPIVMTKDTHERASDRVAEAVEKIEKETGEPVDIAVMIQGDEPMIKPEMIDGAITAMLEDQSIGVVNLMALIRSADEQNDPNCPKVAVDRENFALLFSRKPISSFKQVCVMPFRRDYLLKFSSLEPTTYERDESIDMNRFLEHGHKVKMVHSSVETYSVDTPEDLKKVERLMAKEFSVPETSIIIRTYNEEKNIDNLFKALKDQSYRDFEVIVVDSGSTDRTPEVARSYGAKIIEIPSRDFTFGYSLNLGCREARGRYLVFASSHILPVNNDWLKNLVYPLENGKVAMVYGRQLGVPESKFSEQMDFQRLFGFSAVNSTVPIDYANNANSAVRKDLWEKRKFNEYLFGLEDIDWARAMTKEGYLIRYEPRASIYHIHTEAWHQVFNRYRREAIAAVRIGLKEPPQSGVSYLWLFERLISDIVASFPNWSLKRVEEILRFRYYQWKGSRTGWHQGDDINFESDKAEVFYPLDNKSVIIKGKDKAEFKEQPLPELNPGDVLLSVDYVGICRTDLEVLEGTLGYYRDGIANYPIVPGHEFSGTVARIGSNTHLQERFKVGDKVVGECILSRDSANRQEVGVINYNGAYSKYMIIPGDALHHIPAGLDPKVAAMAEPLAVVLRAIRRIKERLKPEASIAVIGAGPIGNLAAQTLSLEGYQVSVFDKNQNRLDLIKDKVKEVGVSLDHLPKFDALIEGTGSKEVLERVIRDSKNDATIMLLGFPYGNIDYNFEDLVGREKVIAGSVGGDSQDFPKALSLLPKLDMRAFGESVFPLEDFEKAWEMHRTGEYLKILLKP